MKITNLILVSCLISTSLSFGDKYLDELTTKLSEPQSDAGFRTYKSGIIDPLGEMCGLTFGMSMDQVITKWGKPSGLEVKGNDHLRKEILEYGYGTNLRFTNNQLFELYFTRIDFPDVTILEGIKFKIDPEVFSAACSNLKTKTKYGRKYYEVADGIFMNPYFIDSKGGLGTIEIISERTLESSLTLKLQDILGQHKVLACEIETADEKTKRIPDSDRSNSVLHISRELIAITSLLGEEIVILGTKPFTSLVFFDDKMIMGSLNDDEDTFFFLESDVDIELNGSNIKAVHFHGKLEDGTKINLWFKKQKANNKAIE